MLVGHLVASLPSTFFFAGGVWLSGLLTRPDNIQFAPLAAGVLLGWGWWLVVLPRWRRWALRHGAPEERVRRLANRTLLTWPRLEEVERLRRRTRK